MATDQDTTTSNSATVDATTNPPMSDLKQAPESLANPDIENEEINLEEAPLLYKFAMLMAVVVPSLGMIVIITASWLHGFMGWGYLIGMLIGCQLTGMGITIGYHRMLAHRAFETYAPIRIFWMAMGALAVQMGPLEWCAAHRRHH